ncbi:MAG: hypothetical protein ACI93R_003944 [Flavobacteriales bacterium]|jgi:hypothetical protein
MMTSRAKEHKVIFQEELLKKLKKLRPKVQADISRMTENQVKFEKASKA